MPIALILGRGAENAGVENAGADCRGGKCRSDNAYRNPSEEIP